MGASTKASCDFIFGKGLGRFKGKGVTPGQVERLFVFSSSEVCSVNVLGILFWILVFD